MARRRDLRSSLAGAVALAAVVGGTLLVQSLTTEDTAPTSTSTTARPSAAGPQVLPSRGGPDAAAPRDGLPTVPVPSLPREARQTLALIEAGGPFPYDQDGSVFGNREGLLPPQRRGCYREYTVRTPGEDDRGARRIVTSCAGPRYWTADHYESFRRIVPARL